MQTQKLNPALTIQRVEGGFPHSEILGSKLVRSSPRLIAAYHVLHRLSAPRHPPNALKALDRSHDRCPPVPQDGGPIRPLHEGTDDQKDLSSALAKDVACLTHPAVRDQRSDHQMIRIPRPRWFAGSCRRNRMRHLFTMSNTRRQAPKEPPANRLPGHPPASPKRAAANGLDDFEPGSAPRAGGAISWWSQTGSNRRHHDCKARALPTELWPPEV